MRRGGVEENFILSKIAKQPYNHKYDIEPSKYYQKNAVKIASTICIKLPFYFYVWKMCFSYETLDQTPTRNGFPSQNQIRTRYHIGCYFYLLEPFLCSIDLEIDIST